MTDLNPTDLRRVAEAATPGPWLVDPESDCQILAEDDGPLFPEWPFEYVITNCNGQASFSDSTARHITTFDPPTIFALLDRLEAAEATVKRVEALHHRRPHQPGDFMTHGQTEFPDLCDHCHGRWPCRTVAALKGDS